MILFGYDLIEVLEDIDFELTFKSSRTGRYINVSRGVGSGCQVMNIMPDCDEEDMLIIELDAVDVEDAHIAYAIRDERGEYLQSFSDKWLKTNRMCWSGLKESAMLMTKEEAESFRKLFPQLQIMEVVI